MKKVHGFTLVELMIVITIVGIIAAIAYPAYTDSVRKSRRSDAMAAVMEAVNAQEKWLNVRNTYTAQADPFTNTATRTTPGGHYLISVAATATTFTVTATAQAGQAQDREGAASCATMTMNQQQVKGPVGSEACWR